MSHTETRLRIYRKLPPDVQAWWNLQSKSDRDYWTTLVTHGDRTLAATVQLVIETFLDDTGDPA